MATSRLSKEAEVKITNSLSEVAELVNSGENPNEAIAKTASANGIPVGHVELMVRAFNVGRSEAQRQSGAEPHEKLAEFELADPKTVMDIMYPSKIKSAAEALKDKSVSDAYSRPPEKTASHTLPNLPPLVKEAAKKEIQADEVNIRTINSLIEKLGSAADKMRSESARERDKIMEGISKLASYFRSFGSKPFLVVKDNSQRLFGKKASSLLDIIESSNRHLKKQAGTVNDIMAPVNIDEEPYKSIKNCIETADVYVNKKASSEFLNGLAKSALTEGYKDSLPDLDSNGSVLDGINKEARRRPRERTWWEYGTENRKIYPELTDTFGSESKYNRGLNKIYGGAFKGLTGMTSKLDSNSGKDADDYKFDVDQLMQNQALKNIRATSALADLLTNDEIISSHHPEDVTFHFNEIGKIMPESIHNTAIMRPLLRKRLEGGTAAIDPFDVSQMLEMESYKRPEREAAYPVRTIRPKFRR
jgi:hypothetical protein